MPSTNYLEKDIPRIASVGILVGIYGSLVAGQLIRFVLHGQGGGILLSDIVVLGVIGLVGILVLFGRVPVSEISSSLKKYALFFLPFIVWAGSVLFAQEYALGLHSFGIAALYLVRIIAISLLFPVLLIISTSYEAKKRISGGFVWAYYLLLGLGYVQLLVHPSLVGIANGWDPHIHRMVATWLDPNFFGAFIVIGFFPVLILSRWNIVVLVSAVGALILTGSRSSWIAFVVGFIVVGALVLMNSSLTAYWKKGACLVFGIIIITCIAGGATLSDRLNSFFVHDPTVTLRADAYKEVWHRLVEPNILFGVGYNAYQFSAKDAGLIDNFSIHSRAGSDSSVLTLLVTTGIIGTALFFLPILIGLYWHGVHWLLYRRTKSLGWIASIIALLVHAQFENSLLYPHLLILMIIISVITLI
jgi:hypothetical protein